MVGCGPGHWAQGIDDLPAGNRNLVERLGGLQEWVEVGRGLGWGAAGQAQVCEHLADHRRVFDGCDERQGPATVRTVGHVHGKHPFEQLGPAHSGLC